MPTPYRRPLPAQRLQMPILLPLEPLRNMARMCLSDMQAYRTLREPVLNDYATRMIEALLDQWFVDPEGAKLNTVMQDMLKIEYASVVESSIPDLQMAFHRLISNTIGTLVPSLRYRYEIDRAGDAIKIIPTLPTLEDYESRLHEMAIVEDAWVPPRFRRY